MESQGRACTGRRYTAGFSLTEALVALLLVGLMGSIMVAGVPAARNVYNSMLRRENAEAVCTTVANRIATELRDATDFQQVEGTDGEDDSYVFVSHSGSALDNMRISITTGLPDITSDGEAEHRAGRAYVVFYSTTFQSEGATYKSIVGESDFAPRPLLPEDTYVLGLKARLHLEPATDGKSVELEVVIYYDGDGSEVEYSKQILTVALGRGEGSDS